MLSFHVLRRTGTLRNQVNVTRSGLPWHMPSASLLAALHYLFLWLWEPAGREVSTFHNPSAQSTSSLCQDCRCEEGHPTGIPTKPRHTIFGQSWHHQHRRTLTPGVRRNLDGYQQSQCTVPKTIDTDSADTIPSMLILSAALRSWGTLPRSHMSALKVASYATPSVGGASGYGSWQQQCLSYAPPVSEAELSSTWKYIQFKVQLSSALRCTYKYEAKSTKLLISQGGQVLQVRREGNWPDTTAALIKEV